MLFNHTLEALKGFTSVQLYNEIQNIKKAILKDISNGNGTNDYLYLSKDLKSKYEEISLMYEKLVNFDLTNSEKYYEDSLEAMNKLMKLFNDECISIKKTNIDYQNELKTSKYYIYKQITWQTGELFREIEVVRNKNKKNGIIPLLVQKYKDSSKTSTENRRKKQSSLYIGPMDIAFYDFYSSKYFIKNSFLFHELIKYERIIHKRIMYELDFIFENKLASFKFNNDEFVWLDKAIHLKSLEDIIKNHYLSISTKRYGTYFDFDYYSVLNKISCAWDIWCKRHLLFFDYFMAIQYLENENELQTQIEITDREINNHIPLSSADTLMSHKIMENKLKFYYDLSRSRGEYTKLNSFYLGIRDNFFKTYTELNLKIKFIHKELTNNKYQNH